MAKENDRHYVFSLRLAFRYLGDYQKSQAAVIEVLKSIYEEGAWPDTEAAEIAFSRHLRQALFKVIVPEALRSKESTDTSGASIWTLPAAGPALPEALRDRDLIAHLLSLPPLLRVAYNLRVVDNWPLPEVASLLALGITGVEELIVGARALLKDKIKVTS